MIEYSAREFCAALRHVEFVRLANFKAAGIIAFVASLLTALLIASDFLLFDEPVFRNMGIEAGPYGTITGVLGFLLSFRTSQSYNRFWDGANAVYDVTGGIYMATSNLVAFVHHGTSSKDERERFKQTVIRIMSLLSASMLADLEGADSRAKTNFEVLDIRSFEQKEMQRLTKETHKTEVVVQWLKTFVIQSVYKQTLSVPAPILTRVFQELDVSMGRYHSADRFAKVPFPFPYVATMDLIMVVHSFVTPIVMINLMSSSYLLPIPTIFIIVFFLWSIHLIAAELENPFNGDANDLDLGALQCELNEKLRTVYKVQPGDVPASVASVALNKAGSGWRRRLRRSMSQKLVRASRATTRDRGDAACSFLTASSSKRSVSSWSGDSEHLRGVARLNVLAEDLSAPTAPPPNDAPFTHSRGRLVNMLAEETSHSVDGVAEVAPYRDNATVCFSAAVFSLGDEESTRQAIAKSNLECPKSLGRQATGSSLVSSLDTADKKAHGAGP